MAVQVRTIQVSASVVMAELDDESVLLNVETGIYFGLGEVGTRIWTLLTEGATPEAIDDRLVDEYEVEPVQLRRDVATFLEHLEREGLIQVDG